MPLTTTKLMPMRGMRMRPTGLPSRARRRRAEARKAMRARSLVRPASARRSAGVGSARSSFFRAPLRWSWRSFAYSAETGSCHTSVTTASVTASVPRRINRIASPRTGANLHGRVVSANGPPVDAGGTSPDPN